MSRSNDLQLHTRRVAVSYCWLTQLQTSVRRGRTQLGSFAQNAILVVEGEPLFIIRSVARKGAAGENG